MCYGTMDLASSLYGHVLLQFPPRNHSDVPRDVSETIVIETGNLRGKVSLPKGQGKARQDKFQARRGKSGPMIVDVYSARKTSLSLLGQRFHGGVSKAIGYFVTQKQEQK